MVDTGGTRSTGPDIRDHHHGDAHDHAHTEAELHAGADGRDHHDAGADHPHGPSGTGAGHAHAHAHDHAHDHQHWHTHEHVHADGTRHAHAHAHGHAHAHSHGHAHPHVHDGDHGHVHGGHHHHGALPEAVRAVLAARRALGVVVAEVPGAGGADLLSALAADFEARALVISASKAVSIGERLPGVFEAAPDAHTLLHAIEDEALPLDGIALLHRPAGVADDLAWDRTILLVPAAAGATFPVDHPSLFAGVDLVVIAGTGPDDAALVSAARAAAPGAGVLWFDGSPALARKIAGWIEAAKALRDVGG
jgi:hypothetical protein